jgi:hypothetical protein
MFSALPPSQKPLTLPSNLGSIGVILSSARNALYEAQSCRRDLKLKDRF